MKGFLEKGLLNNATIETSESIVIAKNINLLSFIGAKHNKYLNIAFFTLQTPIFLLLKKIFLSDIGNSELLKLTNNNNTVVFEYSSLKLTITRNEVQ